MNLSAPEGLVCSLEHMAIQCVGSLADRQSNPNLFQLLVSDRYIPVSRNLR